MFGLGGRARFNEEVQRTLNGRYLCAAGGPAAILSEAGLSTLLDEAWKQRLTVEEAALLGAAVGYRKMKQERHPGAKLVRTYIDVNLVDLEVRDSSWIRPQRLRDHNRARYEAAIKEADAW